MGVNVVSHITGRTQTESVFENGVLRKIFLLNRDEETGGLRKLRFEEFHNLHSSSDMQFYKEDLISEDEMDRACSTHGGR
jgi:hypothetical protein